MPKKFAHTRYLCVESFPKGLGSSKIYMYIQLWKTLETIKSVFADGETETSDQPETKATQLIKWQSPALHLQLRIQFPVPLCPQTNYWLKQLPSQLQNILAHLLSVLENVLQKTLSNLFIFVHNKYLFLISEEQNSLSCFCFSLESTLLSNWVKFLLS